MLIDASKNAAAQISRFERKREALLENAGTAFKLTPKERRIWLMKIRRAGRRKTWWASEARRLATELDEIPAAWTHVVFEKAAGVAQPASVGLLCRVLGKLDATTYQQQFLRLLTARSPIIRMLALQRALSLPEAVWRDSLSSAMKALARSKSHFDRMYALRRLRLVQQKDVEQILSRLLLDTRPEVRLTARAMLYLVQDEKRRAEIARIKSPYDRWVYRD